MAGDKEMGRQIGSVASGGGDVNANTMHAEGNAAITANIFEGKSNAYPMVDPGIVAAVSAGAERGSAHNDSLIAKLHTHDIGTLLTNKVITAPPGIIQEQINFLIGNTDVQNIERNAVDLSQLLRVEYYEYFADYLVVKRAALEPNNQALYIDLVGRLHSK